MRLRKRRIETAYIGQTHRDSDLARDPRSFMQKHILQVGYVRVPKDAEPVADTLTRWTGEVGMT